MKQGFRLSTLGILLVVAGFSSGLAAAWMWFSSTQAWNRHLTQSFVAGFSVYEALRVGTPFPMGITTRPLTDSETGLANRGDFSRLPDSPTPAYVTNISILQSNQSPVSGDLLSIGIVSDNLRYSVSELVSDQTHSPAQKFGNVTQLLATYCSEPIIYAHMGAQPWLRIDGTAIWGCEAAPRDLRLFAALLSVLSLAVLSTLVLDTSAHFDRFARALRDRRRLGGPDSYADSGPGELREIISSVNSYLEHEREQLSKRAIVLSGVSHDLGTPATRIKLRAALISNVELREKLEADVDRMTGMIESVLTYTRSELNVEEPRKISLSSLVESLVADLQDMGRPVELCPAHAQVLEGGHNVFTAKQGHGTVPTQKHILVTARPISLQRAISNLIDNALKYGRRASVELTADADHAIICIEDEGSEMSVTDIEAMLAPFQRGTNTETINGFGLGLTIVATVAEQHGGELSFETGAQGLRACLKICRN